MLIETIASVQDTVSRTGGQGQGYPLDSVSVLTLLLHHTPTKPANSFVKISLLKILQKFLKP